MEEWRNLAKTVPGTLFNVGVDIEGLLVAVTITRSKLNALAMVLEGRRAEEAPRGDIGDNLSTLLGGAFLSLPFKDLDRAISELARLNALHARAGHAFFFYGGHVGLEGSDDNAAWLGWQQRHADALRHTQAALRRLRAAAWQARAAEDAIRSARSCSRGAPRWDAWMEAAIQLAIHAQFIVAMVFYRLLFMREEIAQEFHDASTVVYL
ncbi:hypothetical protein QOZ80_8AG0630460 [Eleusine coracana subsp. coracana]|nr:hypothetical protein QOZ80_8AG0630460 [Eleusine coracana subsp. coracana]